MRVLSIGTDNKIFDEESSVLKRQKKYASKLEELYIIVFTKTGFTEKHIGNLHIYPTNSKSKLRYVFDAFKLSESILSKNNFDKKSSVVTVQDPFETSLVGEHVKKKFGIPLQIQIHTDFLDPNFKNSFLNRIRVFISKFTLRHADGIRVVSSVIKDSLVKKYPNLTSKTDILPIWVNIERFEKMGVVGGIMSPYTILMVSRLTKEKNISLAIEAFSKIVREFPDEGLYIVGDGDQRKMLENKINLLGLEKKVKIVGWERQEIISTLYKNAKIFLSTSDFEGYGMTLVEAGASGVPIISTNVGLAKTDLFKDGVNSYICQVGDENCIVEKLIDLIINEEKRKSFVENMHANIKSISITEDEYIDKYISLLSQIQKNDK